MMFYVLAKVLRGKRENNSILRQLTERVQGGNIFKYVFDTRFKATIFSKSLVLSACVGIKAGIFLQQKNAPILMSVFVHFQTFVYTLEGH